VSECATELVKLGPASVPALVVGLEDRDPAVRLVVTRTVAALGKQLDANVPGLARVLGVRLHDSNIDIRQAAIWALLSLGPRADEAIAARTAVFYQTNGLDSTDIICLQGGAAYVLGKLGPSAKAALPVLSYALHDDTSRVRENLATAIWRISCDTNLVLPQLGNMLADTNSFSRFQAAAALQRIARETELSPSWMAQVEAVKHGAPAQE
jgi:HEAT repeat protein